MIPDGEKNNSAQIKANLHAAMAMYDFGSPAERKSMSDHVKSRGEKPYHVDPTTRMIGNLVSNLGGKTVRCEYCGEGAPFGTRCSSGGYHTSDYVGKLKCTIDGIPFAIIGPMFDDDDTPRNLPDYMFDTKIDRKRQATRNNRGRGRPSGARGREATKNNRGRGDGRISIHEVDITGIVPLPAAAQKIINDQIAGLDPRRVLCNKCKAQVPYGSSCPNPTLSEGVAFHFGDLEEEEEEEEKIMESSNLKGMYDEGLGRMLADFKADGVTVHCEACSGEVSFGTKCPNSSNYHT